MSAQPNLVVILTDDQGPWAMGCAGNDELRTPHIDSLAARGVRLDRFHCSSPVCSPARASLLTGRIPSSHGIQDWLRKGNVQDPDGRYRGFDRPVEYLAGIKGYSDYLSDHGYTCALSGKWHMGASETPQKGFSHWYAHGFGGGSYYGAHMIRDGRIYEEPEYVTDAIAADAVTFLSTVDTAKPFHLSVHFTAPHSPWSRENHPAELYDEYLHHCSFESVPNPPAHRWSLHHERWNIATKRRELLAGYFAAVTAMDAAVGRIVAELDRRGLRESTLVVFTSDNGMNMGHHGVWGKGNGTFPMNMYDTSVQVPFIASMPGTVPEGGVSHVMTSQYDVLPTVLDFLQVPYEPDGDLPGRSFASTLRGSDDPAATDDEQVVVFDEYGPVRMIRTADWKYVHRYPYGPNELYNLADDPGENENLYEYGVSASGEPSAESRYGRIIREMRARMEDWFLRYADPATDGCRSNVTGLGQVDFCDTRRTWPQSFVGPVDVELARVEDD
mgnify:CR=1 FL=1